MRRTIDVLALESLDGWNDLNKSEQETIKTETEAVILARQAEQQSSLEVGKRLTRIREILEPRRGMWKEYLQSSFKMSVATAYRYIKNYEVSERKLPKPILNMAIQMGYTIPIRALENSRPPKTTDRAGIIRFLDRISTRPVRVQTIELTPDEALKHLLNEVILTVDKLPKNGRTRSSVLQRFVGMVLTQYGYEQETSFTPIEIPDFLRVFRGRPTLERLNSPKQEVA